MGLKINLMAGIIAAGTIANVVPLTFSTTRALAGYAKTVAGNLTSFAVNTARTTDKGTLIEAAATNLVTNSQTLGSWSTTNCTVTSDAITAPDGTMTAEMVTNNATSGAHTISHGASLGVTNAVTYTGSVYAKAGTHRYIQITFATAGFSNSDYVNFDLIDGTVTATNGSFNLTSSNCGIEPLADGWFRCWMTEVATGGSASANMLLYMPGTATSTRQQSYVGTGTTVYVWGAQFAASTGVRSSYIPTTSASVTRPADIVTASASGVSAGSIVCAVSYAALVAGTNVLCQWDDGTEGNRICIFRNSSKELHFLVASGGVTQCDINMGVVANGGYFKVGVAWSANDFSASLNGWTAIADSSGSVPTGLTTFRLGTDSAGANPWNGYVGSPSVYSERKTDGYLATNTIYPMLALPRPQLMLDIDNDSDIDDMGDLLTALALEKQGECDIVQMAITSSNLAAAGCTYAVLHYYGRTAIPLGVTTTDPGNASSRYCGAVVANYGIAGKTAAGNFTTQVTVARTALVAAADGTVTYITTGGAQSLYNLLNSPADGISALTGLQLFALKVREVWTVGGQWPTGTAVSDMDSSHTAFQWIFDHCPVPLYLLDVLITVPQYLGTTFEGLASNNPARFAWEEYWDAEPADPTTSTRDSNSGPAILAAVRGMANYTRLEAQFGAASVRASDSLTAFRDQVNRGQGWVSLPADLSAMETVINNLVALGP